jgi:hypothetical protein
MTFLATLAERSGALSLARRSWAQLQGNRRALAGLVVIVAIVAADGLFLLRGATAALRVTCRGEQARLARLVAIAREHDWAQRASASTALRARLEDRLWTAESEGIARADLQDWVSGVARDIGLATLDVRIATSTAKSLPPDLRQITATITAQPAEAALLELLGRIEQAPHLLVVERLDVRQQPSPSLEMALTAYARIGHKAAAGPMTPARGQSR